jgi:hypothetical protein
LQADPEQIAEEVTVEVFKTVPGGDADGDAKGNARKEMMHKEMPKRLARIRRGAYSKSGRASEVQTLSRLLPQSANASVD